MKILVISSSPNKVGLTKSTAQEFINNLAGYGVEVRHIVLHDYDIERCQACGERGWGICLNDHKCVLEDSFNELYADMSNYDAYVFVTPVYFHEMSEIAKTFFDRLKRCDAFHDESQIKGKAVVNVACAGGSGSGAKETLAAFDILNRFLKTTVVANIDITKANFEEQKQAIQEACTALTQK